MKREGATVIFRSVSPFFEAERDGVKPNTVRVLSPDELRSVRECERIRVAHATSTASFERAISATFDVTQAMRDSGVAIPSGMRMATICWEPE